MVEGRGEESVLAGPHVFHMIDDVAYNPVSAPSN